MHLPLVSVILSVYNAEKYIEKSIRSVLGQSFQDFEFLIVEDCSTDNSRSIVTKCAAQDRRIHLILKEHNRGLPGYIQNLNEMIRLAKGKYIAKFDADDIWVENKLEKQVKDLETHSNIFLLSANAYEIDNSGHEIGQVIRPSDPAVSAKMIMHSNPFCHPSILFRNEGFLYRPKMLYTEDYDLYLRMFSDGKKLIHRKDFLFYYRILPNSLSRGGKALIQALFKQKAIEFYTQRVKNGIDQYDDFNPDDLVSILEPNHSNSQEDLTKALRLTFSANLRQDFHTILQKAFKQYGKKRFLKYWAISKSYGLLQSVYRKLQA